MKIFQSLADLAGERDPACPLRAAGLGWASAAGLPLLRVDEVCDGTESGRLAVVFRVAGDLPARDGVEEPVCIVAFEHDGQILS